MEAVGFTRHVVAPAHPLSEEVGRHGCVAILHKPLVDAPLAPSQPLETERLVILLELQSPHRNWTTCPKDRPKQPDNWEHCSNCNR